MKNYTTRTAALKATTIDTRILDTKILKINGESLEDVILQTVPKGINNAVRISTTIGSIKNDSIVTSGDYQIGLAGGMLWVQRVDGISGHSWQPVQVVLGGEVVLSKWELHVAGHWEMVLWESGDDLTQIYGGVSDGDLVEVIIIIPEQHDGDEPVQTSLTGDVQHNVVYHLGEEANLNLTLPTSLIANYAAEVVFTSGAKPTVVRSDSRIKWVGDDVISGVFTPVANVRYSCSLQYDGVFVRGMAFGIPTV
jgi:hypothetical protein